VERSRKREFYESDLRGALAARHIRNVFKLDIIECLLFPPRKHNNVAVEYYEALVVGADFPYCRQQIREGTRFLRKDANGIADL
jgi:hypothetical protein